MLENYQRVRHVVEHRDKVIHILSITDIFVGPDLYFSLDLLTPVFQTEVIQVLNLCHQCLSIVHQLWYWYYINISYNYINLISQNSNDFLHPKMIKFDVWNKIYAIHNKVGVMGLKFEKYILKRMHITRNMQWSPFDLLIVNSTTSKIIFITDRLWEVPLEQKITIFFDMFMEI